MNRYYIDVTVHNRVGVLNRITAVFSRLQINISSLMLTGADSGETAEITIGFNCTKESKALLVNCLMKIYDVTEVEETDKDSILFS